MPRPTHYTSEAQRWLWEECRYSAAEIRAITDGQITRASVSQWKSGRCTPDVRMATLLERAVECRAVWWQQKPKHVQPPAELVGGRASTADDPKKPVPNWPPKPPPKPPKEGAEDDDEPAGLGLNGLERIIARVERTIDDLPAKDRLAALREVARLTIAHDAMRVKATTAQEEYLAGPEFAGCCRVLLGAFPQQAVQFREALGRIGVQLPEVPSAELAPTRGAPTKAADLDALLADLAEAKELFDAGEIQLAWAHTLRLELDVHVEAIARLLERYPKRAPELLDVLCFEPDRVSLQGAVELRFAVADLKSSAKAVREKVATLLECLHRSDLAAELGK